MKYAVQTYAPKRARQRRRRSPLIADAFLLSIMIGLSLLAVSAGVHAFLTWNTGNAFLPKNDLAETDSVPTTKIIERYPLDIDITETQAVYDVLSIPDDDNQDLSGSYDFSKPVPLSNPVDTTYFDDAVLIGDSRTEGLYLNTNLSNATSFAHVGLTVGTVFTKPLINVNGGTVPIIDALKSTDFSKVYIMLGINETGWVYSSVFIQKYGEIVDSVRGINPDAIIYIQAIMPVSQKVSSTHSYVNNPKISEYNQLLQELAEAKQVYYIDTTSAVSAEDGSLPEEAAPDGIHLTRTYCQQWLDYLMTHTVAR